MLDLAKKLIDFIVHINVHLAEITREYGTWTYAILFLIIFAETGFVVTPFLPGDSLLFAAGTLAQPESGLNVHLMAALLWLAAVLGDNLNYWIGYAVGPKVFKREDSFLLRRKHLEKANAFFVKYGVRSIILARFVPIVRTFMPFIAGVGRMNYRRYLAYDILGGFIWIYLLTYLGYFFGTIAWVQKNFEIVILAIVFISLLPMIIEVLRAWLASRKAKAANG